MGERSRFLLHPEIGAETAWLHYSRLFPVWVLITYIFVLAYTRRSLRAELAELRRINEHLTGNSPTPSDTSIEILANKTRIRVAAARVSHVSVEDHYCYVHHLDRTGWRKTDVAVPLKDVVRCVPDSFVLVHRSHLVNLTHSFARTSRPATMAARYVGIYREVLSSGR